MVALRTHMYKPEDQPLGVHEIAIILNVQPDTVSSWQIRKIMPIPDTLINKGRTRLWRVEKILDWASATGRNPKGIDSSEAVELLHQSGSQNKNGRKLEDFTSAASGFDDQWGNLGDYQE